MAAGTHGAVSLGRLATDRPLQLRGAPCTSSIVSRERFVCRAVPCRGEGGVPCRGGVCRAARYVCRTVWAVLVPCREQCVCGIP